jgi:hypothetical protein
LLNLGVRAEGGLLEIDADSLGAACFAPGPHAGEHPDWEKGEAWAWVRAVHCRWRNARLAIVLGWRLPAMLRAVELRNFLLDDEGAILLASSPLANRFTRLILFGAGLYAQPDGPRLTLAGARAMAESPHLDQLRSLTLLQTSGGVDPDALDVLRQRFGERLRLE